MRGTKGLPFGWSLLILVFVSGHAYAQHDLHRDTVKLLAADELQQAKQLMNENDYTEYRYADRPSFTPTKASEDPETYFVKAMRASIEGNGDEALEHAKEALDRGMPFGRFLAGPRDAFGALYATGEFQAMARSHDEELLHGPMVGNVTGSSATIWLRTAHATDVEVKTWEQGKPSGEAVVGNSRTAPSRDYTAEIRLEGLSPDTAYRYEVRAGGSKNQSESYTFRTFPKQGEAARFTIGFGGGAGYVPRYARMWDTISERNPLAFFMLGDNVYIDDPEHALTQQYCYYRRQSQPKWRRFVANTAMYAIYDDHDFGDNDCVPGPAVDDPPWKREVWERFKTNWVNPYYGGGEPQPGCWFDFYIGDVHFIMLDGRYYRDLEGGSMLGPAQKQWLFDTLDSSRGTFKVVASPVPWTKGVKPGSKDPWDGFPEEREAIFDFIANEAIEGVILMSADRHRSDIRITEREHGYDLIEFESSRLTNIHTHSVVETPGLVFGYNEKCSFGLIEFDTSQEVPTADFKIVSIDGEDIYSHTVSLEELTIH